MFEKWLGEEGLKISAFLEDRKMQLSTEALIAPDSGVSSTSWEFHSRLRFT